MVSLLVERRDGRVLAVVIENGEVVDIHAEQVSQPSMIGDVFIGRVKAVQRDGAFVEFGVGAAGFLNRNDGPILQEGASISVVVARDPYDGKGAKLKATDGPPRRLTVGERLERLYRPDNVVVWPVDLAAEWPVRDTARVGIAPHSPLDPYRDELSELLRPRVQLSGGGVLSFYPTPALVAIDVDRGRSARSADAINAEAASVLPRQVRLRGLSGLMVVDLLKGSKVQRADLVRRLRVGFARDPAQVKILPISDLGLCEISRERRTRPLHETIV